MTSGFKTRSIAIIFALSAFAGAAWAQEVTPTTQTETAATEAAQITVDPDTFDSRSTREELHEILQRHPREVGVMLKLDPSLFTNADWIASYPALAEFVKKHPEVPLNSSYYLEWVWIPGDHEPEPAGVRMARQTMEGVTIFATMLIVAGALSWLIRTLLEHRRWSRVSRVQTEIYNKLLDRFTSHEDLLRYVQSTSGKDFIQSAITPISTGASPSIAAPISRILWSLQAGVILVMIGLGLFFVSGQVHPDATASFSTLGILSLCAGIGFAASAVVAWTVSKKLGILPDNESSDETGTLKERTLGE